MSTTGTKDQLRPIGSIRRHVLLRPLLAVGAGVLALVTPETVALVAALAFGVYCLGDGLISVAEALLAPAQPGRRQQVVAGVLVAALGLPVLVWPQDTVRLAVVSFAGAAILLGLVQAVTGVVIRRQPGRAWIWAVATGIVSVGFGLVVLVHPVSGLHWITWVTGGWAIAWGAWTLWLAARLRRLTAANQP